jgi:hypothetical protein
MDLDIAKELSQLQEKKLELEVGTDLSDKCDTIVELDRRVGLLSKGVRSLHDEVEQYFDFDDICEQLVHPYKVLNKTNLALDLLVGLSNLNRVCQQIDINLNLIHSADGKTVSINPRRTTNSNTDDDNNEENATILQVLELLEDFEARFKPLEEILSKRNDLPYLTYATKVRYLKKSVEHMKHKS